MNERWQTDLFTFVLKRQNLRVYLVAFLDDHSRFVTGFGLHARASTELVLEVLRPAIASYGAPLEVLTDNSPQYVAWRGKSTLSKELEKHGIRHVVAPPVRPQPIGKCERLWGTVWLECVERTVFLDLADARRRLAFFFDHYNFHRVHRSLGGLVPADRFFSASPEVLDALKARVSKRAHEREHAPQPGPLATDKAMAALRENLDSARAAAMKEPEAVEGAQATAVKEPAATDGDQEVDDE